MAVVRAHRLTRVLFQVLSAIACWGLWGMPAAHARVQAELLIGNAPTTGGFLGDSYGTLSQEMAGLPTTRAEVEGNLSSGTLRATALTDYFRNNSDPNGFTDSYTSASAQITMGDLVTFTHVPIGAVAHLDLRVTGSFSTVPQPRRIPQGSAWASVSVATGAPGSVIASDVRTRYFAADANSALGHPQDQLALLSIGPNALYFETLTFDLLPTTYQFAWTLGVNGAGYDVDFSSTAKAYLRLPEGVTYTSQSGVFLATAEPLSPVPWPPMWQLTLAGLGLMATRIRQLRVR